MVLAGLWVFTQFRKAFLACHAAKQNDEGETIDKDRWQSIENQPPTRGGEKKKKKRTNGQS